MHDQSRKIEGHLKENGETEKAPGRWSYLKSTFKFITGISVIIVTLDFLKKKKTDLIAEIVVPAAGIIIFDTACEMMNKNSNFWQSQIDDKKNESQKSIEIS